MTRQEALDINWDWFVVQGKPEGVGVDPEEGGLLCMYRGKDGCRCAAGTLIPDDDYDSRMEGNGFCEDFVARYDLGDLFPLETITFVGKMQTIHDSYQADKHGDFTDYMRKEITELAIEHNLTIPEPVAA